MLLSHASLSAGLYFYTPLKHIFRGDAYPDHDKIHTTVLMYVGCTSDKEFITNFKIRSEAKITPEVQSLIVLVRCIVSSC